MKQMRYVPVAHQETVLSAGRIAALTRSSRVQYKRLVLSSKDRGADKLPFVDVPSLIVETATVGDDDESDARLALVAPVSSLSAAGIKPSIASRWLEVGTPFAWLPVAQSSLLLTGACTAVPAPAAVLAAIPVACIRRPERVWSSRPARAHATSRG